MGIVFSIILTLCKEIQGYFSIEHVIGNFITLMTIINSIAKMVLCVIYPFLYIIILLNVCIIDYIISIQTWIINNLVLKVDKYWHNVHLAWSMIWWYSPRYSHWLMIISVNNNMSLLCHFTCEIILLLSIYL